MNTLKTLLLILGITFPFACQSQSFQHDLAFVLDKLPKQRKINLKHETRPSFEWKDEVSSLKILLIGPIQIYQILISSQDASVCNFTPSCSRFSVEAIRKFGIVRGILLTSDRLQRDIRLPGMHRHYKFDYKIGKFIDPVDKYVQKEINIQ